MARQLTLRITGSHFAPGSKVGVAVINIFWWKVLARGATYAQRTTISMLCGDDGKTCSEANPRAGTINYRVWLSSAPRASNLLVLYRSPGDAGTQGVTVR